jgi:hypothetical protein
MWLKSACYGTCAVSCVLVHSHFGFAIYTRKSTEHNLDLAFTSLDAQREACEAYIRSQAREGSRL